MKRGLLQPVHVGEIPPAWYRRVRHSELLALLKLLVKTARPAGVSVVQDASEKDENPLAASVLALKETPAETIMVVKMVATTELEQQIISQGGVLTAELDEGVLQVELNALQRARVSEYPSALLCPIPQQALLIQKRACRRVQSAGEVILRLDLPGDERSTQAHVENMSETGIAFTLSKEPLSIVVDEVLHGCQLKLPNGHTIPLSIELLGAEQKTTPPDESTASTIVRGRFLGLNSAARALIQRYIFQRDLESRDRQNMLENLQHSQTVAGEPTVRERL